MLMLGIILLMCYSAINVSFGEVTVERQYPQWASQLGIRGVPQEIATQKSNIDNKSYKTTAQNSAIDLSSVQSQCSEDEILLKSGLPLVQLGNDFYYFETYFKANFFKAMQFCKDHGMDLVSIETEEENTKIITYLSTKLSAHDKTWTSGSDLGEEGNFVWLATGKPLSFTYWTPPQPDNAGNIENCMEIQKLGDKHYTWNDRPCNVTSSFICEVSKCTDFCMKSN